MPKFFSSVWQKVKSLSRRQILTIVVGLVGLYLVVWLVNLAVLWGEIHGSSTKVQNERSTIDAMVPGVKAGSRLLDYDLHSHHAIGRVGDYYLSQSRFDALAKTKLALLRYFKGQLNDREALIITRQVIDRMIEEQLVAQLSQSNHLLADQNFMNAKLTELAVKYKGVKPLQNIIQQEYGWSLAQFNDELRYSILRAEVEQALGGRKFADVAKGSLQNAVLPKVTAYASNYTNTHTNYLISGGYRALAKRVLTLK